MAVAAAGSRPSAAATVRAATPAASAGCPACRRTCANSPVTAIRRSADAGPAGTSGAAGLRGLSGSRTGDPVRLAQEQLRRREISGGERLAAGAEQFLGGPARAGRRPPGAARAACAATGRPAPSGREGVGGGQREAAPIRRGQARQDDLAGQRVAEREAVTVVHHQLRGRGAVQRRGGHVLGDARGRGEQPPVEAAAEQRRGRQDQSLIGPAGGSAGLARCPRTSAGGRPGRRWPAGPRPGAGDPRRRAPPP